MKKNFKKLLLLMAVVITAVVCLAFEAGALDAEGQCGADVYWKFNSKTGEIVISGSGAMYDYDWFKVSPFSSDKKIKKLTIKDGVTSIGDECFCECENLTDITISDSVKSVGYRAFLNTGYSLKTSNWENKVLYIGKHIIDAEYELFGIYQIREGTISIGAGAFEYCSNLDYIIIPNSVKNIGDNAFASCKSLTYVSIPDGVTTLGRGVFMHCTNLNNISISNSVLSIGAGAFSSCSSLLSIVLPNHLTEIPYSAFLGCESLSSITIPKSVSNIDLYAFDECNAIKYVYYTGTESEWNKINFTSSDVFSLLTYEATVHYNFNPYMCAHDNLDALNSLSSTCIGLGLTKGEMCSVCGTVTVAQKTVDKKPHTYKTTTTKATLKKNGKQVTKCTVCGDIKSSKTIYYPKSVKLSTSTYTYNGKTKTPTVVVKDSKGNTLKKDTDYTVKYASGRKNPGKYTVTVTFKGKYSGTKKLTLTIKPKAPSVTDIYSKTKGKAVIKWNNVAGESGYQLYYSTSKNGTYKKVKSYEANKLAGSKTKLKSGKTYYFKVRAYKKTSSGTVYSSWSAVKSVKVK